ncbi:MAG: hypothetical protein IJ494_02765 [Bacteroides sp.]|nr:hypothetical protein [Bacteroides sp.]
MKHYYEFNRGIFTKSLLILLIGTLIFLSCTFIRALPIGIYFDPLYISSPIGLGAYFVATHKLCNKFSKQIPPWYIPCCMAMGLLILQTPARILAFKETAITLPEVNCHLLGILLGFFSQRKKIAIKVALTIAIFFLFSILSNRYLMHTEL